MRPFRSEKDSLETETKQNVPERVNVEKIQGVKLAMQLYKRVKRCAVLYSVNVRCSSDAGELQLCPRMHPFVLRFCRPCVVCTKTYWHRRCE